MDVVKRPEKPKKEDLIRLYDVCNRIFKKKECFYTHEEVLKLEKEKEKL